MKVIVTKNYDDMSAEAAKILIDAIKNKPDCTLGLATGSTPVGTYDRMVAAYERGEISFLQDQMAERGDVYIDTAGMRSGAFAVEKAVKAGYAPYLVYGSTAPLFELMSTVCTVDMDPCAQEVKDRIFDGHGFVDALMRG